MSPLTHSRFHRLDEITLDAFRALPREKTVVILPVGMIEEHGPHLPLGTDNWAVDAMILAASTSLLEGNPALHVLMMPAIPYGTDPVDLRRPELFAHAGSVWISRETLKQVIKDVAGHMVRYGFRTIFPVGFHGGADQSRVLGETCAEMRAENSGLVIYEPLGYVKAGAEIDVQPGLDMLLGRPLKPEEHVVLQGSIHASMLETSMMLHLHPELVDPSYKGLRTMEWSQIFRMENWPGYAGAAPARANPELGAAVLRWRGVRIAAVIRRALNGEDLSTLPRHPAREDAEPDVNTPTDLMQAGPISQDDDSTPLAAANRTQRIDPKTPPDTTQPGKLRAKD